MSGVSTVLPFLDTNNSTTSLLITMFAMYTHTKYIFCFPSYCLHLYNIKFSLLTSGVCFLPVFDQHTYCGPKSDYFPPVV